MCPIYESNDHHGKASRAKPKTTYPACKRSHVLTVARYLIPCNLGKIETVTVPLWGLLGSWASAYSFLWVGLGATMDTPFLRAQHYHDQAAHLRKLAEMDDNEPTRKALIELAESYDRLS